MLTLKLAARNLWRHKRRTLLTASAIVFSFGLMLVFIGLSDGAHGQMIEMGVRMGSGHVVVQARGYQDEQTVDRVVRRPEEVVATVARLGIAGDVAVRLMANGLARAGDTSVGVMIAGVQPAAEARVNDLAADDKRVAGGWLRERTELPFENLPSDLYLGATLAQTLDVNVGDRVALTVQPKDADSPRSMVFLVRGVFRSGNDDFDGFFAAVPLADARQLVGVGDAATQVAVVLRSAEQTDAARDALARALAGQPVEVLRWQEALPELHEFVVLDDASMYLFLAVVFALVALGIFNTVLMSVIERTKEFGLMMSLGLRGAGVLRVVMTEAVLLGLAALAVGLGLGLLGNHYLTVHGLDYRIFVGDAGYTAAGVNVATVMYADLRLLPVVKSVAAVFGVVLVSALWPALRAARLKPLEALHHV